MAPNTSTKYDLEKFDGSNDFSLWRMKMRAILIQQGLLKALKENQGFPETMSADKKEDMLKRAHSALLLSLALTCYERDNISMEEVETVINSQELRKKVYENRREEHGDGLMARGARGCALGLLCTFMNADDLYWVLSSSLASSEKTSDDCQTTDLFTSERTRFPVSVKCTPATDLPAVPVDHAKEPSTSRKTRFPSEVSFKVALVLTGLFRFATQTTCGNDTVVKVMAPLEPVKTMKIAKSFNGHDSAGSSSFLDHPRKLRQTIRLCIRASTNLGAPDEGTCIHGFALKIAHPHPLAQISSATMEFGSTSQLAQISTPPGTSQSPSLHHLPRATPPPNLRPTISLTTFIPGLSNNGLALLAHPINQQFFQDLWARYTPNPIPYADPSHSLLNCNAQHHSTSFQLDEIAHLPSAHDHLAPQPQHRAPPIGMHRPTL
ncbi:hypothetical protein RJ639_040587 [Escallonia herrerae]|uniref:Uncharacterized protein n=1 Tax=Escallonia herrerae TaxID=1293975 RepID=A0AA88WHM9_9ASTE|nr:hypothetical protein RJ639_040587 [Escallonia herrerae]